MSVNGKKYKGTIIFMIILLIIALSGCGGSNTSFYDNSGNSINGGIAVANGKSTVYTDGSSLFEVKDDVVTKLFQIDGSIQGMVNVYDKYIYFYGGIERNDGTLKKDEAYYRFDRETSEVKLILPYKPLSLSHYQDRIYFINPMEENAIFSCNYDGKDMKRLIEESTMSMAMDKDYIYYVSGLNLALHKAKLDGSNIVDMGIDGVLSMMVYDKVIYFKDGYNDYKFTSVDQDGQNKKVITENNVFSYNINHDYIFYSGDADNGGIFKIKAGDGEGQSISNDMAVHINITDQYIFYRKMTDGRIYRCDLDGTDETLIQN